MSTLNIWLVLLVILFWGGNLFWYFRKSIYEWLDNRIHHEPLTDRLRGLFGSHRR